MTREAGAIVLAAGLSTRMGRPKMLLPWGQTTVIEQVVSTLALAQIDPILVVAGESQPEIELVLVGSPARVVFNSRYREDAMLFSLQAGLRVVSEAEKTQAILVVLGDQPQMRVDTVQMIIAACQASKAPILAPSYQMRRGHPWLVKRALWPELLSSPPSVTLRSFLQSHADQIQYVPVASDSVLQDLDTPEDYVAARRSN